MDAMKRDILVADDDEQTRTLLRTVLEREGHRVRTASDGIEALRAYDEASADLVITDILMPNMDGVELIVELRRRNPGLSVICISGGGKLEPSYYLHISKLLQADYAFEKPIPTKALLDCVKQLLISEKKNDQEK